MSAHPKVRPVAGSISFPFENLAVRLESGERRRFGAARFAFDGAGAYWPISLTVEAVAFGTPARAIEVGSPEWRATFRSLEHYHQDDVMLRIAEACAERGAHMAIFDEHLPSPAAGFRPPPYNATVARHAALLIDCAAGALEAAALLLFLGFIAAACFAVEASRLPAHSLHQVAKLEVGAGR